MTMVMNGLTSGGVKSLMMKTSLFTLPYIPGQMPKALSRYTGVRDFLDVDYCYMRKDVNIHKTAHP